MKEEALDRNLWRTRFGRGYGPVVRQSREWNVTEDSVCWGITLHQWVIGFQMFEGTYRHSSTYAISSYAFSVLCNLKKVKKTELVTYLDIAQSFSLREWKSNESKVVGEYCWAITQAAGAYYAAAN
jgi:hypothetical protein